MDSSSREIINSSSIEVSSKKCSVELQGESFKRQILLADANVPNKLAIDRCKNKLFFCINADDFSDQSFYSVVLDLMSGVSSVIEGICNGYASAVDPATGNVYLGGSNGIFKYNYQTSTVEDPVLKNIDILDMFFKNELYFVDTAKQNLCILRNDVKVPVKVLKDYLIQNFIIDGKNDIYFVNSTGLFVLEYESQTPDSFPGSVNMNFRGGAVDIYGRAHFITEDGIFYTDKKRKQLQKWLSVKNGYGLAFDAHNNIIYSDERSISKIYHLEYPKEYKDSY